MSTYTLIAFKPEHFFNDRGDDVVLPARLVREDGLTREEVVDRVFALRTERPLIEYRWGHEPDVPFEEFHAFGEEATPLDVSTEVQERYDAWEQEHHPAEYARRLERKANMNQNLRDVLQQLGYVKDST